MTFDALRSGCVVCGGPFPDRKIERPERKCCSSRCSSFWARVKFGLPVWTAHEDSMLRVLSADGFTNLEISALLAFNKTTVLKKKAELSLTTRACEWGEAETDVLRDLYEILGNAELSALLGRSLSSVTTKLKKMKLKRPASWYLARGLPYLAYPPELQEVIQLQGKLKRQLKNEKHRRSP